ncbi:uncharacterized protein LOC126737471 isoform X2 [Anthonomus grandis grandis]|nr:uncharacterized protein LOC126737471 isoform X2 [Anthonomus grandis grandis]
MKNHILENASVMKTTKMHVFNTGVVKDIVNLYNWKGPDGLKALEKNNKTVFEVDKLSKSKVSECVHDFLLVLCTSHKYGVIFRDPLVGLGRKNLNGLMYTVLDSLDRPWEHSYAKELVIKICRSCPDLTKNMWSIVKPYLEPRNTEKWLKALEFSKSLVQEMNPVCIEHCAKELSPNQLSQIMEILVTPAPILKTLLINDNSEVKVHVLRLLSQMLKKLHEFMIFSKGWTTNFAKIKQNLANFVSKNYPNGHVLLEEWKNIYLKSDQDHQQDKQAHLEIILDILGSYKDINSQLLHNLSSTGLDFKEFILKLTETPEEEQEVFEKLLIKTVSLFVDTDYALFLPKSETFGIVMTLLLKHYYNQKDQQNGEVLFKMLKISRIFDGALYEIPYWINGIFNVGHFDANLAQDLVNIIIETSQNLPDYQKALQSFSGESDNLDGLDQEDLIQDLLSFSSKKTDNFSKLKAKNCSVMVLGALKYHSGDKSFKKYLEFVLFNLYHSQTNCSKLRSLIDKNSDAVPKNILNYVKPWEDNYPNFGKAKHLLSVFKEIADMFFMHNFKVDLLKQDLYPHYLQDVLNMLTYYVYQLADLRSLNQKHLEHYIDTIKFILEHQKTAFTGFTLDIILGNQNILKHFNVLKPNSNLLTKLILLVVLELQKGGIDVKSYLPYYGNKIFGDISKLLRKLSKFSEELDFKEYLLTFPLSYDQTQTVLSEATNLLNCGSHSLLVQSLVTYGLERSLVLSPDLKPIDNDLIKQISKFLAHEVNNSEMAKALRQYLECFPCSIKAVKTDLFTSLLNMPEYNKDCTDLALLLLERNLALTKQIDPAICDKKGLVLPVVELLLKTDAPNEILQKLYDGLESSLLKALQKPQKVGQHFQKCYKISGLIEKFMSKEKCLELANKVQKFEVTEVFHVELLQACFSKVLSEPTSEKHIGNIIMTFIHLEIGLFKKKLDSEADKDKVDKVSQIFCQVLEQITNLQHPVTLTISESYKSFCKFALKYGVSGQHILLKTLKKLINVSKNSLSKDDASVLMEMLLSHSEFLNLVLGEHSDTKYAILSIMLIISENWGELVEKSHVAVVLSAYRGLVTRCDRVILDLLKIYESKPDRTSFYDFKPFLWGRAAATHYSVRSQLASSLTRQPKISDVLGILKEHLIHSTILNHPLTEDLQPNKDETSQDLECYDLKFFLPLFSHILAPEQQVKTYVFIRSGGLSLTVLGLACQSKEIRQAACHVLSRLHFHLEARQTGKDNLLWIRFVEALCKGVAVLPDFKLNNFSGIFFARMATILTNPKHIMYTALSSYLTAKQNLDLSTCPELYTLLFSPDVNHKEHRNFILEVLRDGMKGEKDFLDLLKSMGYKMFSELLNSCLCDSEGRLLIFEVLKKICLLPLGVKILTENYSFLCQIEHLTQSESNNHVLGHILSIYFHILIVRTDTYSNRTIFDIVETVFDSCIFSQLKDKHVEDIFRIFYTIYQNDSSIILDKEAFVSKLTSKVNDRFCNYLRQYGCAFINENSKEINVSDSYRYLRLLIFNILK